jgi:hypothetical protein
MEVSGQLHDPTTYTPRQRAPGNHWIGGWAGPRAGLDVVAKRKIPSPYRKSNSGTSARSLVTVLTELPRLHLYLHNAGVCSSASVLADSRLFNHALSTAQSRGRSVGAATGYGLDDRGSIPSGVCEVTSSAQRPNRLWGSPNFLSKGYRRQSCRVVKLTT